MFLLPCDMSTQPWEREEDKTLSSVCRRVLTIKNRSDLGTVRSDNNARAVLAHSIGIDSPPCYNRNRALFRWSSQQALTI